MKIRSIQLQTLVIAVLEVIIYMHFSVILKNSKSIDNIVNVLSVCGLLCLIYSILSWYRLTGEMLSLYTIFLLFAYLFTFGQCILWAFGIHVDGEIGTIPLYYLFSIPTSSDIAKAQFITITGLVWLHAGVMIAWKEGSRKIVIKILSRKLLLRNRINLNTFGQICKYMLAITTIFRYYLCVRNIFITERFGYGADLYNPDVVNSQNNIIILLSWMYFPSIIGVLLSTRYAKKWKSICYIDFAIFAVLSLLGGDRGVWLYPLLILIWMSNRFYEKISFRKLLIYGILGIVVVVLSVAVRNIRSTGISIRGIIDQINSDENPIVSSIMEMGASMQPLLAFCVNGIEKYPYGNTYLLSLLGMVTEKPLSWFISNYIALDGWFSERYLKISWGAGFNFIAEAYINFGPIFFFLALFVIGLLISNVFKIDTEKDGIQLFFCISTTYCLMSGIRNTSLNVFKSWFFSVVLLLLITLIVDSICKQRKI